MNSHTAQHKPPEQLVTAKPPSAAHSAGRVRLGSWLRRWVERAVAASERAQAHITAQFRVPPGGG
ncbi:hypothetical protein OIN59_22755 [Acidovorax sp. D2M1]|uniref:Uncharacterized protein n=1 Tax=Acidovorax benzenivorans TaxID=2987520 RepID=A0ABT5S2W7_9BURK|nr:hypothetical protein [Acidovorax benzenivorans]MDD2180269.1 hypothetical protein [Acidovorax benzenivorans]